MKRVISFIAVFALSIVTLTQVSAFGFCANTADIFIGGHKVINDSQCSHSQEDHVPSNCSDASESCEDNHIEIDLDIDDFTRVSSNCETLLENVLSGDPIYLFSKKYFCTSRQTLFSNPVKTKPNLPVFLRFGILRL